MSDKPIPAYSSLPLAVALRYEAGNREAPHVVAKGQGPIAERIVALAKANDVLIDANPELARALGGLEVDEVIPIELFEAVAEVIGFVLRAKDRLDTAPMPMGTPQDVVEF